MRKWTLHDVRSVGLAALLLGGVPAEALAQSHIQISGAPSGEDRATDRPLIATSVSGTAALPRGRPVVLEYADSPKLTALLERELSARGVAIASATARNAIVVRIRGVLQLTGKHTARIRISELAEQGTLVEAADGARTLAPADLGYVIAAGEWLGRLVQTGRIGAPVGAFLLLDVVGQSAGAKDWFNRAVGGDRRGICLVNCEAWHTTRQTALHVIDVQDGVTTQRAEVRTELRAEALQPGPVVSVGLAALVDALAGSDAMPAASGTDHARPSD